MAITYKHIKEKIKHHFHEVLKTKTSPHSIALGFSIGTFIALLPTPGFNVLLGFLILLIFEKVNKFSLFAALAVWNPFTQIPIYFLSYKLGDFIFRAAPVRQYEVVLIDHLYQFTRRYLIGNLIIAVTLSLISYFIVKKIATNYKAKSG
jgi:uncharacterized protein